MTLSAKVAAGDRMAQFVQNFGDRECDRDPDQICRGEELSKLRQAGSQRLHPQARKQQR